MNQTFKDTPLSEMILRKYEKPESITERELVKKFMLSVGLLQPGDSRDVIVDIFQVMLENSAKENELSSDEINQQVISMREKQNLKMNGIAPSNVRRQLKRLRELMLIEKRANKYRVSEFMTMNEIFEHKLETFYIKNIIGRIKEYCSELDKRFVAKSKT